MKPNDYDHALQPYHITLNALFHLYNAHRAALGQNYLYYKIDERIISLEHRTVVPFVTRFLPINV